MKASVLRPALRVPETRELPVANQPLSNTAFRPYASVPEFIYGITREIWEDRGVGRKLQQYYAPDVLVRSPANLTVGQHGVTAQTLETLHQFPDRQLVGEDVIWTGDGQNAFLSSHRLISVMRHTGQGSLGPVTHRVVRSRVIADCWVVNGQVTEEWLVRDQAAFARSLGVTPEDLARKAVDREIQQGTPVTFFEPQQDRPSRYLAQISDDTAVERYLQGLRDIWHEKTTASIRDLYFDGALLHGPGGESFSGHGDIDRFIVGYLASFPDATLTVHNAIVNRDPEQPIRVAARWSLSGHHLGFGHFGEPSGAPIYVLGMSHAYITEGRVRTEYLLTDEVSIWKQIYAQRHRKRGS